MSGTNGGKSIPPFVVNLPFGSVLSSLVAFRSNPATPASSSDDPFFSGTISNKSKKDEWE